MKITELTTMQTEVYCLSAIQVQHGNNSASFLSTQEEGATAKVKRQINIHSIQSMVYLLIYNMPILISYTALFLQRSPHAIQMQGITIPVFQKGILRCREVKRLDQSHTAGQQQIQEESQGLLTPNLVDLFTQWITLPHTGCLERWWIYVM